MPFFFSSFSNDSRTGVSLIEDERFLPKGRCEKKKGERKKDVVEVF